MNNWRYAGIEYDDVANGIGWGQYSLLKVAPTIVPNVKILKRGVWMVA